MRRRTSLLAAAGGLLTLLVPVAMVAPAQADSAYPYVRGVILDAAGRPAYGISVEADWCRIRAGKPRDDMGCSKRTFMANAHADPTGTYVINARDLENRKGKGHVLLVADYQDGSTPITMMRIALPRRGHTLTAPTFRLPVRPAPPLTIPADAVITGTLSTAAGAPARPWVTVATADGDLTSGAGRDVFPDPWGHYVVTTADLPPGTGPGDQVKLMAWGSSWVDQVSEPVTVPAHGATVTENLTLTPSGTVVGTIEISHAARGWRGHVNFYRGGIAHDGRATTDANGRFRKFYLEPGVYRIEVRVRRFHPSTALRWDSTTSIVVTAGGVTHLGKINLHR